MIGYVLVTRDRPERLAKTLGAIGAQAEHDAEVVVVDNASAQRADVPGELENGIGVSVVRLGHNAGASGRNVGVEMLGRKVVWAVMLDDDSHPTDVGFVDRLAVMDDDVFAVSADIVIGGEGGGVEREQGGLPEVFVGCGVAIRREAYMKAGGYDAGFGYYVEEYDLAAKLLLMGGRVIFEPGFRVVHHKVSANRDMNVILEKLVRNNGWVMARYAPDEVRQAWLDETVQRYERIAQKEGAMAGYARGLRELQSTVDHQPRTVMDRAMFDRFTGLAQAREAIDAELERGSFERVKLVCKGKNAVVIRQALCEREVVVGDDEEECVYVVGTMSPGPMIDGAAQLMKRCDGQERLVVPWVKGREVVWAEAGVGCHNID